MENNEKYTCKDCKLQRNGDCFGHKPQICERFDFAPTISEEVKKNWPAFGDATYIRLKKARQHDNYND